MTRIELESQNLELRSALREIYDRVAELLDLETCEEQEQEVFEADDGE